MKETPANLRLYELLEEASCYSDTHKVLSSIYQIIQVDNADDFLTAFLAESDYIEKVIKTALLLNIPLTLEEQSDEKLLQCKILQKFSGNNIIDVLLELTNKFNKAADLNDIIIVVQLAWINVLINANHNNMEVTV